MANAQLLKELQPGKVIHNFVIKRMEHIKDLNLDVIHLIHDRTKAEFLHIEKDDPNKVLSIAFPSFTENSKGTSHILEHVTLCGSREYPVRDPFFKMLNRSVSNFMNAMTASDHTMYPFATENEKDFENLRDIYADSVFNPLLKHTDFLQEGWRLENKVLSNPLTPLSFKGVVYNEMKGALSDVDTLFASKMQREMFSGSIYGYESGGDPVDIVNLSYDELVQYHNRFYNPRHARIFSYGNYSLEKNLKYFNYKLPERDITYVFDPMANFTKLTHDKFITVDCPPDPRIQFLTLVATDDRNVRFAISYYGNHLSDLQESFNLSVLCHLLLDGPTSPMYKALINTGLGTDFTGNSGYDSSTMLSSMTFGVQGAREAELGKVRDAICNVFEQIERNGFNDKLVYALLNEIELQQKRPKANFGLNLAQNIAHKWIHGGDPVNSVLFSERIRKFRDQYAKGNLFQSLIKKYFTSNQIPRLFYTMKPKSDYNSLLLSEEKERLMNMTIDLTEEDRQRLCARNLELEKEQKEDSGIESLPIIDLADISPNIQKTEWTKSENVIIRNAETNGINFIKGKVAISEKLSSFLPFIAQCFEELAPKGKDIDIFMQERKEFTGGTYFSSFVHTPPNNIQESSSYFTFGSHALVQNTSKMIELVKESISSTNFSDHARLMTILDTQLTSKMNSLAYNGHVYAMLHSASQMTLSRKQKEEMDGISQMKFLKSLKSRPMYELEAEFESLSKKLWNSSKFALIGDFQVGDISQFLSESTPKTEYGSHSAPNFSKKYLVVPFATNFAAMSFPTVQYTHKDSVHLRLLASYLRSKFLLPNIREKNGAYGGGASMNAMDGIFSFYSYRDPNPLNTVKTFTDSLDWIASKNISQSELQECKLTLLSQLDAPMDIDKKGLEQFTSGLTDEQRQRTRNTIFEATSSDIVNSASHLRDSSVSVFGSSEFIEDAKKAGMEIEVLE